MTCDMLKMTLPMTLVREMYGYCQGLNPGIIVKTLPLTGARSPSQDSAAPSGADQLQ